MRERRAMSARVDVYIIHLVADSVMAEILGTAYALGVCECIHTVQRPLRRGIEQAARFLKRVVMVVEIRRLHRPVSSRPLLSFSTTFMTAPVTCMSGEAL